MTPQVQAALDKILGSITALRAASGAGRIFELFVMTGIALELKKNPNYEVWLERSDETRIATTDSVRDFIQRGGAPTGIKSKTSGPDNASFIVFRNRTNSKEWEIWNGIQFCGRSGGSHEIDLAIVPRSTGGILRNTGGGIPIGRPRVSIECKDVINTGAADEMRAFIARLYDLTLLTGHSSHMTGISPLTAIHPANPADPINDPAHSYYDENKRTFNAVARQSGFSAGACALTSYYHILPYQNIKASTTNSAALFKAVKDWCITSGY